jgi:3-phosphoshikimate 1-carboxyvinyltransferase
VRGQLTVPGDKSLSHRYALLGAIADLPFTIDHYAPGADCASTLSCLADLGVAITRDANGRVSLAGRGLGGLREASQTLDAGNSGSTVRMLAGILAAHAFASTIDGDASLRRRPMRRIIDPLTAMGASFVHADGRLPLTITGAALRATTIATPIASAQVKSALLLAGLHAEGETRVVVSAHSRDHTERALRAFGVEVITEPAAVVIRGRQPVRPYPVRVAGDPSSAAFWAVAQPARLRRGHRDLLLNPSRTGFVDVLRAGARVEVTQTEQRANEPVGRLVVRPGRLGDVVIAPHEVPSLIDELPVLAALATFGGSVSVSGAEELRAKESDRITALVTGLVAMGADAQERPDGFVVRAAGRLRGGCAVEACHDHRLAMAFAVAALGAAAPVEIPGADVVDISYPDFFETLETLRG